MWLSTVLIALSAAFSSTALTIDAKVLSSPLAITYDFIVVGAGVGGSVMASRLSENPKYNVLLIEAGDSDLAWPTMAIPILGPSLTATKQPYLWNYVIEPQEDLYGRTFAYPRGKVAGGSSSINYMFINQGSSQEWDRIARVTREPGWGYASMRTYLKKFQNFVPPQDGRSVDGQYDPSAHGTSGPIKISLSNHVYDADDKLIASANSVFPFNRDFNAGGSALGIGYMPFSTGGGYRNSASVGYLHANNATARPNLTVLLNAQVTRLNYRNSKNTQVSGVTWSTGPGAREYTVSASKEVILAAGSINTPQILMLSGIGPKRALKDLKIKCVADLPVGQNLSDHPLLAMVWEVRPDANTYDPPRANATILAEDIAQWQKNKTGRASSAVGSVVGWARLPDNDPIWRKYKDPSAGDKTPHMESIFGDGFGSTVEPAPTEGRYLSVTHSLVAPASLGQVTLASTSPWDEPLIDPGYFTSELDRYQMVQNILRVRNFLENAKPLKGFLGPRWGLNAVTNTAQELTRFVTNYTQTIWHPSGTAAMSPKGSSTGVTNPDLTVKGIDGLRIVDLSVFPYIPQAHPQGYLYGLAERAADVVKAKYSSRYSY